MNGGKHFSVETSNIGQLKLIELHLIRGFRYSNFPKVVINFLCGFLLKLGRGRSLH